MATPDGGDSDLPKEKYDIINCVAIHYEIKDVRAGTPSFEERSSEPRKSRTVITLKTLKETVRCVYEPSLDNGNEKHFTLTDTWKETVS